MSFDHRRRRGLLRCLTFGTLLMSTLLAACSLDPFRVTPPPEVVESLGQEPGVEPNRQRWEPRSEPVTLSYCYNKWFNDPEDILARANVDCEGGRLEFREQDAIWNGCAVMQPIRVSYVCYPPSEEDFVPVPVY